MKQVINITLNSVVFAIEKDAYQQLDVYLSDIRNRLVENDDQSEIISDIEAAIAEKFTALGRSEKLAVSLRDVEQVSAQMGTPADFGEEVSSEHVSLDGDNEKQTRRLFRDTDDAVIAGVASGIARYFSIDPVLVRVAFVLSIFVNGIGLIAYAILWLIVPAAHTTADKFAMQGKRVTVDDIAAKVKKNLNDNNVVDAVSANNTWQSVRNFLQQAFVHLGGFIRLLMTLLRYLVGIGFVLGGALSAAVLVSVYSVVLLSEKTFLPADAQTAIEIMFATPLGIIAIAASFVMNLIPFLVVIVIGASLLKKQNLFTTNKTITLATVWIVALVLAGTASALQVEKVWQAVDVDLHDYDTDYQIIIDEDSVSVVAPVDDVEPVVPAAGASTVCTDEMRSAEACIEIYAPVCGQVDVQCVTTPCPPIPETFSNGCFACAQGNVSSYTQGVCVHGE